MRIMNAVYNHWQRYRVADAGRLVIAPCSLLTRGRQSGRLQLSQARVESVSQPIADEVDGHHDKKDGGAWEYGYPPLA